MFKGLIPTVCREMSAWAIYFWSYELYKKTLGVSSKEYSTTSRYEYCLTVFCGGMAGVSCWLVCYPFDVIKVQLQTT
jgi:hypothetical protein